jgi:hypothetical protein
MPVWHDPARQVDAREEDSRNDQLWIASWVGAKHALQASGKRPGCRGACRARAIYACLARVRSTMRKTSTSSGRSKHVHDQETQEIQVARLQEFRGTGPLGAEDRREEDWTMTGRRGQMLAYVLARSREVPAITLAEARGASGKVRAAAAVAPLLRFLERIASELRLLAGSPNQIERKRIVKQALRDLRVAAQVLDQFDTSIQATWTEFENLLARAREVGIKVIASRGPAQVGGGAEDALEAATREIYAAPQNLLPEAVALWRKGFSVRTANRLVRAGFRTFLEVLAFRPPARLHSIRGLGLKVVEEAAAVMTANGYGWERASPLSIEPAPKAPQDRRAVELAEEIVRRLLGEVGGTATITELLQHSSELSFSRLKRGLLSLEQQGVVSRTGIKRSTRYHLAHTVRPA